MAFEGLCVCRPAVGGAGGERHRFADNWKLICCTVKKKSNSFSRISNLLLANSNDLSGLCHQHLMFLNIFLLEK